MEIEREHRSPHHKPRTQKPTLIVVHASAGKSDAGDVAWICDPRSKVSYHYLVGRDGTVYELVAPTQQAWHAGISEWKGRKHCNAYSIGVAWSNRHDGQEPLTGAQIAAMRDLLNWLCERYPSLTEIVTHAQVSPGRKDDPNRCPNFYAPDWLGGV